VIETYKLYNKTSIATNNKQTTTIISTATNNKQTTITITSIATNNKQTTTKKHQQQQIANKQQYRLVRTTDIRNITIA
jgi:hypothetical protein